MREGEPQRAGRLAYREASPAEGESAEPVLFVHGFPESSYMWRRMLPVAAADGRRAIAPDLLGFGDAADDPPHTWRRQIDALDELVTALELGRLVLVVHDWGGLIGLRWACENPERIAALLISDTGFFPDGRWHGMAEALRTQGQGEELLAGLDREAFGGLLAASSRGFDEEATDEYYRGLATPVRKAGALQLYRSGELSELSAHRGALGALGVPTLLLWGADDAFAPVGGAHRFQREIPGAELEVLDGAGHFVFADEPEACAALLGDWLSRLPRPSR